VGALLILAGLGFVVGAGGIQRINMRYSSTAWARRASAGAWNRWVWRIAGLSMIAIGIQAVRDGLAGG
jgi:hypothetical protein